MSNDLIQIHLTGKGPRFSGRGVRLRLLDVDEQDLASRVAAKEVGAEATNAEYQQRRIRECMSRMIVEVTEQGNLGANDLLTTKWVRVTQQELESESGPRRFAALFSPKDIAILRGLYRKYHEVTEEDLDAIEGKALEVSGG